MLRAHFITSSSRKRGSNSRPDSRPRSSRRQAFRGNDRGIYAAASRKHPLPFTPVRLPGKPSEDPRLPELIRWGRLFHEMGCAPSYGAGSHGNLSLRTRRGCLITATRTFLGALKQADFVEIVRCDPAAAPPTIWYLGRSQPSTDSLIHWQMYRWRPQIQCVLHAHDAGVLARAAALGLPQTSSAAQAGSPELIPLIKPLARRPYFLVKDHGFVAVGRTIEEAGELAAAIHKKAAGPRRAR